MLTITPYVDQAEAQTYFNERLNTPAWDNASDTDKLKALKASTRAINALNFIGSKTVISQVNEFPRSGDISIPDDIKVACCENAYSLLDGADIELERANLVAESQGISDARSTYNRNIAVAYLTAGIASSRAWDLLRPYLRDGFDLRMSRV